MKGKMGRLDLLGVFIGFVGNYKCEVFREIKVGVRGRFLV